MAPLSVDEAQQRLLEGALPLVSERCPLADASSRVLGQDLVSEFDQPPFRASAMDGYAVRSSDFQNKASSTGAATPHKLEVIGTSRAGHPFDGVVLQEQAVRIFTGAPLPDGADAVVCQEDCRFFDPNIVEVSEPPSEGAFVRPKGYDFKSGQKLLTSGTRLNYRHLAVLASMNVIKVPVRCRPRVAILATGDELQAPGAVLGPGQIYSSVPYGIKAMVEASGGVGDIVGIALDDMDDLKEKIKLAKGADVLVTIGGASVGDHDLVQNALKALGMTLDFWRIAMRPGKPLMVGKLGPQKVIGVPGNPVSAMICTQIFIQPLIKTLLGLNSVLPQHIKARLNGPLPAGGARQHYMRAALTHVEGQAMVTSLEDQDSSLQALFAASDALIVRPVSDPPRAAGDMVDVVMLDEC